MKSQIDLSKANLSTDQTRSVSLGAAHRLKAEQGSHGDFIAQS